VGNARVSEKSRLSSSHTAGTKKREGKKERKRIRGSIDDEGQAGAKTIPPLSEKIKRRRLSTERTILLEKAGEESRGTAPSLQQERGGAVRILLNYSMFKKWGLGGGQARI